MNFVKNAYDVWESDDDIHLAIPGQLPETALAQSCGHDNAYNAGNGVPVKLANLTAIGPRIRFGEARVAWTNPKGGETKWTGDCYSFGLCSVNRDFGDHLPDPRQVLIIEINGAGNFFYLFRQSDALALWKHLLVTIEGPRLWDLLHGLTGTWLSAQSAERKRVYEKLVRKQIQIKKVRGQDRHKIVELQDIVEVAQTA